MQRFAVLLCSLMFVACSPVYKTVYKRIPAQSESGLQCTSSCNDEKQSCQEDFDAEREWCLGTQRSAAMNDFPILERQYTEDLRVYNERLRAYYAQKQLYDYKKDDLERQKIAAETACLEQGAESADCLGRRGIKKRLKKLYAPRVPYQPREPSLAHSIAKYQQSCNLENRCGDYYDSCFVSCGGQIIPEQVCTKRCNKKLFQAG